MLIRQSLLETFVERRYKKVLKNYHIIDNLINILNTTNEVFIFGGWIRDCVHEYIHNQPLSWNDIDLVIKGKIDEQVLSNLEKNNFGGFKLEFNNGKRIDFWELEKTFAFREKIFEPSIENLLRSTVFTVNSLVFTTKSFQLMDYLAIEDISKRMIKFNCKDYLHVFPELQVFRAIELADKLGYEFDNEIRRFILDHLKKTSPNKFLNSILIHKKWVSKQDVDKIYAIFKNQL